MTRYAQTILELMASLRERGFSSDELRLVHNAYELAAQLTSGQFRPSGKTFLAHLVGTGAVLAAHGATAEVTAAGVLHAAYDHGDFGTVRRGPTAHNRAVVREAASELVEQWVYDYEMFTWNRRRIDSLPNADLAGTQGTLVFMRIANALEDHLDDAIIYAANAAGRQRAAAKRGPILVDLAGRIGKPELGVELAAEYERLISADVDELLEMRGESAVVQLLLPRSARTRIHLRLLWGPGRILRRLGGAVSEAVPVRVLRRVRSLLGSLSDRRVGGDRDS